MLVPSMTPEEVYKELSRDFKSLYLKGKVTGDIFQSEMKRKRIDHEFRFASYKTAQRNEWQIIFNIFRDRIGTGYYLRSTDKVGMVAYILQFFEDGRDMQVAKYNTHFFKRYRDRVFLDFDEQHKLFSPFK